MDEQERKNWETVKQALEEAGKQTRCTTSVAVAICAGNRPVRISKGFTF